MSVPIPDADSFNGAVREAVARRRQWCRPINIWMITVGQPLPTSILFEARADSASGPDRGAAILTALDNEALEKLAGTLDDTEAFDALVREILIEACDNDRS